MNNMANKHPRSCKGFTLIELMTVIAIMAIMAGIAIPNYMEWSRAARLRGATNDLTSDLAMARLHAIKSSTSVKVIFSTVGYMIFIDDNNDDVLDSGEVLLRNKQYPAGVTMSSTTFTNSRTIFPRTGHLTPDDSGRVRLRGGNNQQIEVFVNAVGRIRVVII